MVTWSRAELILQPFRHFTYVTTHSPILPSIYLRHSSFSNPSFASPTSEPLPLMHLACRPWQKADILRISVLILRTNELLQYCITKRGSAYSYSGGSECKSRESFNQKCIQSSSGVPSSEETLPCYCVAKKVCM